MSVMTDYKHRAQIKNRAYAPPQARRNQRLAELFYGISSLILGSLLMALLIGFFFAGLL